VREDNNKNSTFSVNAGVIPIVIDICAFVISTVRLQSSPKWRHEVAVAKSIQKQISRLRFAALEMTRTSALIIHNWYYGLNSL
jgi:hypothetical protein